MLFSVIIPTCNRPQMLKLCLDKLTHGSQTIDPALYEVIVTDDGADLSTNKLITEQFSGVTWVKGPGKGPAANRNNGAKAAKGDWLVFTDDDCLPNKEWLFEYQKGIAQHPACKAFEGAILPDNWKLLDKDMAECPVNTVGGCFWSANIMVEHQLFDSIGGFDEQFKIAAQEDQDLQKRLQLQTTIKFVKEAVVVHPVRIVSLSKKLKNIDVSVNNWLIYENKYAPKNNAWKRREATKHLRLSLSNLLSLKPKRSVYHFMTGIYFISKNFN